MYQIKVDNTNEYQIELEKAGLKLNGEIVEWDMSKVHDGTFHIIRNGRSFNVQVVKADREAKAFVIRVNGNDHVVSAKDRFDLLLGKLGMTNLASAQVKDIKAPMPGLVLQIIAEPGKEVKKGDQVLILEAMKMENVLKAPGDGVVKAIKVKQGDAVEKNQVLVELE